jgi:hypothetical protein
MGQWCGDKGFRGSDWCISLVNGARIPILGFEGVYKSSNILVHKHS